MKLTNRENAHIPPGKITAYLLSETHSVGKSKAKLLRSMGFHEGNAVLLEKGLLTIAHSGDLIDSILSPHGVKYVIDGTLQTPDGGYIRMRTIWIIDEGGDKPRFVTAYPV